MTAQSTRSARNLWQLSGYDAQLQVDLLSAHLNLQSPASGIGKITWNNAALSGRVLGIALSSNSADQGLAIEKGFEGFARGADLVARYPQTEAQPFSLEVYWRVEVDESVYLRIDAIVSLQTSLLECYPAIKTMTSLAAKEAWHISQNQSAATQLSPGQILSSDEFAGVMLRSSDGLWSYLEMTHPEDLGIWHIESTDSNTWNLQRTLGGEFQEKGVIRRLRVRGIFLPQENDLAIAPGLLTKFANSPPPLTA